MSEYKYVPDGMLQGDDKPMKESGASRAGEFNKSLADAKRSDLKKGYCAKESFSADSDKPDFA
jgi:hypothetical protein